jgi:hypothetical protein
VPSVHYFMYSNGTPLFKFSFIIEGTNEKVYKFKNTCFTTLHETSTHRHLSNIDCLTAHTACLVCFISTVNGCSKKKKLIKTGDSSGHITNLKQSILETFDIYASTYNLTLLPKTKCFLLFYNCRKMANIAISCLFFLHNF